MKIDIKDIHILKVILQSVIKNKRNSRNKRKGTEPAVLLRKQEIIEKLTQNLLKKFKVCII